MQEDWPMNKQHYRWRYFWLKRVCFCACFCCFLVRHCIYMDLQKKLTTPTKMQPYKYITYETIHLFFLYLTTNIFNTFAVNWRNRWWQTVCFSVILVCFLLTLSLIKCVCQSHSNLLHVAQSTIVLASLSKRWQHRLQSCSSGLNWKRDGI